MDRIGVMSLNVRKKKALAAAKDAGVDCLLVTHLPDVRYLCGFTGSNAALALAGGRTILFTDGRYTAQAKAEAEAVGTRVVIAKKPAVAAACEWMETAGVRRCGFDAARTTVAALEGMRKAVSAQGSARDVSPRRTAGGRTARGEGRGGDRRDARGGAAGLPVVRWDAELYASGADRSCGCGGAGTCRAAGRGGGDVV